MFVIFGFLLLNNIHCCSFYFCIIGNELLWFFTFALLSICCCGFMFVLLNLHWCYFLVFLCWAFIVVVFTFVLLSIHRSGLYFCIIEHSLLLFSLFSYWTFIVIVFTFVLLNILCYDFCCFFLLNIHCCCFYFCVIEHSFLSFLRLCYWTFMVLALSRCFLWTIGHHFYGCSEYPNWFPSFIRLFDETVNSKLHPSPYRLSAYVTDLVLVFWDINDIFYEH